MTGSKIVSFYHKKMFQLLAEPALQEVSIDVYHVLVAYFSLKLYQFEKRPKIMGGWQNPSYLKFRIFSGGSLMVRIRVLNGETLLSLLEVRH